MRTSFPVHVPELLGDDVRGRCPGSLPLMDRFRWAVIAGFGALIALICHLFQSGTCTDQLDIGGGPPEEGSPAAHYCAVVWHTYDWAAFPIAGALLTLLIYFVLHRRTLAVRGLSALGLVLVLGMASAIYGTQLSGYVPQP